MATGSGRRPHSLAGLQARSERCRPRNHHLHHGFALATLVDWYRSGVDVEARLPLLSTFMGRVDPKHSYRYLSASPELLALAPRRLEGFGRERAS